MKLTWLIVLTIVFFQDPIPFKPKEEFELKLDLQFKQRPKADINTIELEKRSLPNSGMHAPYLYINLKVLKITPEEIRIKVTNNKGENLLVRKFDLNTIVKLDLGFTDDVKDRASAHQYLITFLSKEKDPLSRIEIFFEKDGTYMVNGEKRGKL